MAGVKNKTCKFCHKKPFVIVLRFLTKETGLLLLQVVQIILIIGHNDNENKSINT